MPRIRPAIVATARGVVAQGAQVSKVTPSLRDTRLAWSWAMDPGSQVTTRSSTTASCTRQSPQHRPGARRDSRPLPPPRSRTH